MSVAGAGPNDSVNHHATRILPVNLSRIGQVRYSNDANPWLNNWELLLRDDTPDVLHLKEAATLLQTTSTPVAFPTETVYGLGADATRSEAVRGIYQAKQRPFDNPLIVHVCSLDQLRGLLRQERSQYTKESSNKNGVDVGYNRTPVAGEPDMDCTESQEDSMDPIPAIYHSLIQHFWPGPLTILLPNPPGSVLAREVTAGLNTFGARLPDNRLALALIKLAGVPLAAPSANASTKPSPTTAEHVKEDLEGRIDVILDGGPCSVGVESTVVDGLSDPPAILRPGGISIEQLRQFKGWENVVAAYSVEPTSKPKAPGMKYRHYSPKAKVILYEPGVSSRPISEEIRTYLAETQPKAIGIIRTKTWEPFAGLTKDETLESSKYQPQPNGFSPSLSSKTQPYIIRKITPDFQEREITVCDILLGPSTSSIARGIFAALRELDRASVDVIFLEGIPDDEGDLAAAVMNRLRKASS